MFRQPIAAVLILLFLCLQAGPAVHAGPVRFGQQIRPLLSDRCFACHGPDEAQRVGGFRLDQKASAFGVGDSGELVISPGNPEESELFRRITAQDVDLRMPPAAEHPALSQEEIVLIRNWIAEGATWEEHWSYQPLQRLTPPQLTNRDYSASPIDAFIRARLAEVQLSPAERADKRTLIRRVTLDLTGLPPTIEEVQAFLADESPEAYARVVDRLLASPRYGEHMARYWLDAARYGDTHGLHLDNYREMWPYRDWVIAAFNRNLPYDQFVREQLAGDLLENATPEQRIATGFIRCNVTTSEGGSIAEEVYVRNVVDQVVTFGTVFLGATFDCTRCHDHKFDPYTQADFYSLFAYFNSINGSPLDGNKKDHAPVLEVPTSEQADQLRSFDEQLTALAERRKALQPHLAELQQTWEAGLRKQSGRSDGFAEQWLVLAPAQFQSQGGATLTVQPDQSLLASGTNPPRDVYEVISQLPAAGLWKTVRLEGLTDPSLPHGAAGRSANGNVVLSELEAFYTTADTPDDWQPIVFSQAWADHEQPGGDFKIANAIDGKLTTGWAIEGHAKRENRTALFVVSQGIELPEGASVKIVLKHESVYGQHQFGRFRLSLHPENAIPQTVPAEILTIVAISPENRDSKQAGAIEKHFLDEVTDDPEFLAWRTEQQTVQKSRDEVHKTVPTTLVFQELATPKPAFILNRGEYDQKGAEVPRKTPAILPGMLPEWPNDRLGLALWVTSSENPLTARVAVNRLWQQLFGVGLVKTSEDFGSQGEPPSHPELLDWLAIDFVEHHWDIKALLRQLVLSETYCQSSTITPERMTRDPKNRLLSRGPRFRLDAELLRDQALFVAGLLVEQAGGQSVKPPQPAGLWEAVGYTGSNTARFTADQEADKLHRRTLYTFFKRTAPPPQLGTFDSPSREASCVRRERTNTPMQALLLFNDPQYLECAQGLARRGLTSDSESDEQTAGLLFEICTARRPSASELAVLTDGVQQDRKYYTDHPEQAAALNHACQLIPQADALTGLDPVNLAAWTVTANVLLTMDVFLNKN